MVAAVTVTVDLGPLVAATNDWVDRVRVNARAVVDGTAEYVEGYATNVTPVDTGLLKSQWGRKVTVNTTDQYFVSVVNPTPYGGFVEYGTYRTRAQPMIRPAVQAARSRMKDVKL